MSREASVSFKRLTVALFQSSDSRSSVAGGGGPASPGRGGTNSFSLAPVASARKTSLNTGAFWAAATLSIRERNPLPTRAAPLTQLRRFMFIDDLPLKAAPRLQWEGLTAQASGASVRPTPVPPPRRRPP